MMFKKTLLAAAMIAFGGVAFTSVAVAATNPATSTFQVLLKINKACTVTSPSNLDFTNADGDSTTDLTASAAAISVKCSKNLPYTIGLKPSNANLVGVGSMAAQNTAPTTGNTDSVAYSLFQNAANTTVWGDTSGTNRQAGVVDTTGNVAKTYTVYGKVLGTNLNVTPDNYKDTVTISVYY